MNCNDVAAILDSHRNARLTAAERATVDEHLSTCEDCDAAWHAHTELLALRVPPIPATLLDRALAAARVPPLAQPRRAWRPIAIGATLLAGAALAGVTIVSLTRSPSAGTPPSTDGEPPSQTDAADAGDAPAAAISVEAPPSTTSATTAVELVNTSVEMIPFLRTPPEYPKDALEKGIEGSVTLRFDVTATGTVENASVVQSTDPQFEEPALRAVAQWRYLPRIVAGKRAARPNVQTVLRFALSVGDSPAERVARAQGSQPRGFGEPLDSASLEGALYRVWERLVADELRNAELVLDELRATYALADMQQSEIWNAYAYVYTLQGAYDRAIDAYETAIAASTRAGWPTRGRWVELANLYFARNQYDMALKTLLRPERAASSTPFSRSAEGTALIEKLRALGVTEETLR